MATAVQPSRAQSKAPPRQIVAGRRPDGLVHLGVELAADQPRHQAAEGGADLVGAGGEVLADQADDAGLDAGDRGRNLEEVDRAVEPRARRRSSR